MLAWFVTTDPQNAIEVFRPWLVKADGTAALRVRREYRKLDLVLEFPGFAPLVIENKAFALPDEAQLAGYSRGPIAKLDPRSSLVLLSLSNPGWSAYEAEGRQWRWVSYDELGARLASIPVAADFRSQVVRHEADLLRRLHEIIREVEVRDGEESFALETTVQAHLDEVGLGDAVGKSRAHQVMARVGNALEVAGVPSPGRPLEIGFTNKRPLLAGFWQVTEVMWVGWQLQGGQWRLAMILTSPHLKGVGRHPDRAAVALDHEQWFDFTALTSILASRRRRSGPGRTPH